MAERKSGSRGESAARRAGRDASAPKGASAAAKRALRRGREGVAPRLVLERTNYLLLAAGVVSVVAGFILLAAHDITLAPILLVLGYCFLFPAGLLWRGLPVGLGRSGQDEAGE